MLQNPERTGTRSIVLTQPLDLSSKLLVLTHCFTLENFFASPVRTLNVSKYIMKVPMSFPITVHPCLCWSKPLKYVFFNRHKNSLLFARLQAKMQLKPKQGKPIPSHDFMPLRVQLVENIFYPLPVSQLHRLLPVCPSVRAVAHLHHLPILSSVERVELVGSDLMGRGWRGAVVFASALRHVLLGLRECLLISWGDGVWQCWNLHNIHTMFCLYYSWWEWDKSIVTITAKITFIWRLSLPQEHGGAAAPTHQRDPHHFWRAIPSFSLLFLIYWYLFLWLFLFALFPFGIWWGWPGFVLQIVLPLWGLVAARCVISSWDTALLEAKTGSSGQLQRWGKGAFSLIA